MNRTKRESAISILAGLAVIMASLVGMSAAGAAPAAPAAQPENGSIEVKFTPLPDNGAGAFCLPPFLGMQSSVGITPTTFTLKVTVETRLCNQVNAVAAIYGMPGNGVAWPQELKTTKPVSIRERGITEIIFTRGCAPEQYDVIVGATPQTISPLGPWHGPLLFPFDVNTSLQSWECGPPPSTTSTTSSTTTTTIDDNCSEYTPSNVSATPTSVAPGATVTVSGDGTPGTMIQVILRPKTTTPTQSASLDPRSRLAATAAAEPTAAANFAALSDPTLVGPDGKWSTQVIVPADAQPGDWVIAAYAVGCDTETTTEIVVTPPSVPTTSTPPSTAPPVVAGQDQVATPAAVASSSGSQGPGASVAGAQANRGASGLAFTGTSAHLPLVLGIGLVTLGGLLLLRSRRKGAPAA